MNANFIITKIENIIYVDKNQYPERVSAFCGNLPNCELIYHISGKMSVYFNGKTEMCDDNTLRFLPKGENRGYTVTREENGDCIDIFFDTDKPISSEMFTIKLNNGTARRLFSRKFFHCGLQNVTDIILNVSRCFTRSLRCFKNKPICLKSNTKKSSPP